ncbi:MAG TPA: hypothetical protein DDW65_24610 [Firmicutes bacterium]|nr:hypothetical protein [Bacillota bacterium]
MSHIQRICVKENYRLEVFLDNGSSFIINLSNRLKTIRFSPLANPDFFKSAVHEGDFVRWGGQVEISLGELLEWAGK